CDTLGQSNYPHNQSTRGSFDYEKLSLPPVIDKEAVAECEKKCVEAHHSGDLFVEELTAELFPLETTVAGAASVAPNAQPSFLTEKRAGKLRDAVAKFARHTIGNSADKKTDDYLEQWQSLSESAGEAKEKLKHDIDQIIGADASYPDDVADLFSRRVHEHL